MSGLGMNYGLMASNASFSLMGGIQAQSDLIANVINMTPEQVFAAQNAIDKERCLNETSYLYAKYAAEQRDNNNNKKTYNHNVVRYV